MGGRMMSETKEETTVVKDAAILGGVGSVRAWSSEMGCDGVGEGLGSREECRERGERAWWLHQSDGYFEDVVADGKVGEAVPGALGAGFGVLAGLEEGFAAVVEAGHDAAVRGHCAVV